MIRNGIRYARCGHYLLSVLHEKIDQSAVESAIKRQVNLGLSKRQAKGSSRKAERLAEEQCGLKTANNKHIK